MKHIFIVNPKAGKKDITNTITAEIKQVLNDEDYIIYQTKGVDDARVFVSEYAKNHLEEELRFYSCGGDGTLNEVVNGAYGFDHVSISCYPSGSGNDFIKYFGNHKNDFLNLNNLICGKEVMVDLLKHDQGLVLNIFNMGFDADVGEKMTNFKRWPLVTGKGAYILGVIARFFDKFPNHFKLSVDDEVIYDGEALLCAVSNAICYGGGFYCTPRAKIDDGIIDVVLVKKLSRFSFIRMISSYKKGTHLDNPNIMKNIIYTTGKKIMIESKNVLNFTADGEMGKTSKMEITIIPKTLRFVIPSHLDF